MVSAARAALLASLALLLVHAAQVEADCSAGACRARMLLQAAGSPARSKTARAKTVIPALPSSPDFLNQTFEEQATAGYLQQEDGTGAGQLACGYEGLSGYFNSYFAAANQALLGGGLGCGRCISVKCTDADLCSGKADKAHTLMLVDDCGDCTEGGLRLSPIAFSDISGLDPMEIANFPAEWEFIDCGDLVTGGIRMVVQPGGNSFFRAISFSNARSPIVAARIDGNGLNFTESLKWTYQGANGRPLVLSGPSIPVDLLAADGTRLSVNITKVQTQDLYKNFEAKVPGPVASPSIEKPPMAAAVASAAPPAAEVGGVASTA